jgi:tetratricopeptide (TPR) repeat protein
MLSLLAVVVALGVVQLPRTRGYQEYLLRRMHEPELRARVENKPGDALAHYYLGQAYDRTGLTVKAARQYAKALVLDPSLTRACPRLAELLVAGRQVSAAETLLRQGLQIDPTASELHAGLARIQETRHDFRQAAAEWQAITSLAPNDAEAWYHLGRCWMSLSNEAQALPAYQRAVELVPLSAPHQEAMAGVLRLRGRYAEAERHCRRALHLRPDDPEGHFELAKLLRDRDGSTPQTEESMGRAVSLRPDDPLLRYYLGSVYQEQGRLQPAVAEYQATLRLLRSQEPSAAAAAWGERSLWLSYMEGAHFNLAGLLQRLGRSTEAADHRARFRRISDYHLHINRLIIRIANQPGDASLRRQLARLQAAGGEDGGE